MLAGAIRFKFRRGSRTLTVTALSKSFAGFIDDKFYVVWRTPEVIVRQFIFGTRQNHLLSTNDTSKLVQAAKRAVGDADEDATPLSDSERKAMDEVRREARRPSKKAIERLAKSISSKK